MSRSGKEKRAKEIQASIRDVLMSQWDPINVCDVPEAQDEYDGYVGGIYHLLSSGAGEKQLFDHLYKIETEYMGLKSSKECLKK